MDNGLNERADELDLDELKRLLASEPGAFISGTQPAAEQPAEETAEEEVNAEPEVTAGETEEAPQEPSPEVEEKEQEPVPEEPSAAENKKQSLSQTVLLYLHDFTYLLAAIMLVFMILFRVVVVSGPSMRYTLLDGDYLLLLSSTFYRSPEKGDVVVVCKESFQDGLPIVKRVIAVEGQEVDIDFAKGIVYVDGVALEEPYVATPTNMSEGVQFPLTVEEGCVFVMGDNRNNSRDSRYPAIGLVDKREILGKAILLFLPGTDKNTVERDFSRIGGIS